ncbi:putative Ig domain-containing protein [Azospirillum thermophilum]|uniref:putative Ig domain-containing protein n=1 Tax=Azospirillum thermophilum TaxID=2202148 RepID=UPI003CCBDD39
MTRQPAGSASRRASPASRSPCRRPTIPSRNRRRPSPWRSGNHRQRDHPRQRRGLGQPRRRCRGTTSDIAVTEGQQAVITVALTTSSSTAESYPLTLTGVTATPGPDFATGLVFSNGVTYDAATGKVTVPAGVTRFTVAVATVDDALVEQAETVTLSVAGVTATIAIVDNDVIADRDVPRPPAVEQAPAPAAAPAAVPVEVSVPVVAPSVPSPGFAPLVEPALTPYSPFSDAVLPTRFDGLSGRGLQHELRVDKPLPDVLMPAGVQTLRYVLPTDTFIHTDRSARVELSAVMEDGSKLPGWLVFDAKKGEFSGTPRPATRAT